MVAQEGHGKDGPGDDRRGASGGAAVRGGGAERLELADGGQARGEGGRHHISQGVRSLSYLSLKAPAKQCVPTVLKGVYRTVTTPLLH